MKFNRAFSIAVLALIAAGCATLSGPASATVLCPKNESTCKAGAYPAGTQIKGFVAAGASTVFENEFGDVSCLNGSIVMKVTSPGGEGNSTPVKISALSYSNCNRLVAGGGLEKCTVAAVNLGPKEVEQWGGVFQAESPANGNGLFSLLPSSLGSVGLYVHCGLVIACNFTPTTSLGVTGGPTLAVPAPTIGGTQKMKTGGVTCPVNAPNWRNTWEVTEPGSLFLETK